MALQATLHVPPFVGSALTQPGTLAMGDTQILTSGSLLIDSVLKSRYITAM